MAAGTSTTTRTSHMGCSSCMSRPARSAGSSRRTGRAARDRALRRRGARRFLPLAGRRRRARAAHQGPSGHAEALRQLDARVGAPRLGRIWGDDELERRAVSVFRLVEPALRRAPGGFAWMLCGLDLWFSRRGRSRSPVPSTRRLPAPHSPRSIRAPWSPGPTRSSRCSRARGSLDGETAVYVCERFVCRRPVTDPAALNVTA